MFSYRVVANRHCHETWHEEGIKVKSQEMLKKNGLKNKQVFSVSIITVE